MIYRLARMDEIPLLAELRKRQLVDEGSAPDMEIDMELDAFFRTAMADGSLVEWVAEEDGQVVATAAILFFAFPPSYTNKSGKKGYITNMYTAPACRGQGIATKLLGRLAEEARSAGVTKLWLGASHMGRPVYERFGFRQGDHWMELDL